MVRQERDERYASTVSATSIDSDRPLIYKLFPRFFPFLLHRFAYRSWRARTTPEFNHVYLRLITPSSIIPFRVTLLSSVDHARFPLAIYGAR